MYQTKNINSQIRGKKILFVLSFLFVLLIGVTAIGAEEGVIESAFNEIKQSLTLAANMNVAATGNVAIETAGSSSADETIQSMSFMKDADIKDALRFLSAKYEKNIVPSPSVGGKLAFTNLYNVTFEEAMDAILGRKYTYEEKGNLVKVFTREDKGRMTYKVFTLYHITAVEARKLISATILSTDGKIEASAAAETGVPTSGTISSNAGGGDTVAMNDTLIVYDYPENIASVEKVIKLIDVRPKQVLIEATILSATLTETTQFGIDWQTLKGTAVTGVADITSGALDFLSSAGTGPVTETGGLTMGIALGDVGAFMQALEKVTDITVLANPKILAVNKQLGQVYIGRKVGYRDNALASSGSTVVSEGEVKFLDTGTKLSFRPYISEDGYIRMDIHPKDSSGSLSDDGIPNEDSAELVTNIMVKDGQTIVIGGLFRDKTTVTKTQIPLLGDIPFAGALFRGTSDKTERQEVMVLLTPHIIEEPNETDAIARAEDVNRKRAGVKDSLQWIGRTRQAEDHYARGAKCYIEGDNKAAIKELKLALMLRPAYLEAIRLKERIMTECGTEIERLMLEKVERQDSQNWSRR